MKTALLVFIILAFISLFSIGAFYNPFTFATSCKIELYSGGELIKTWTTDGQLITQEQNGYIFTDEKTNKRIMISGDVIIYEI